MTGNKFRGETCAFCSVRPSTTDDHVLAKGWFVEAQRDNLAQVPACAVCNGLKAKLESELMVVLPFGARHADSTENLSRLGGKRFVNKANIRHALRLQRAVARPWVRDRGVVRPGMTVPIDWEKVEALCEYIARGLAWHELDRLQLGADCFVEAHSLIGPVGRTLRHLRQLNAGRRVERNIGNQTFRYWAAQSSDNPQITVWEISFYGSLRSERSGDGPHNIGVMTAPKRVRDSAEQKSELLRKWRTGTRLHEQGTRLHRDIG